VVAAACNAVDYAPKQRQQQRQLTCNTQSLLYRTFTVCMCCSSIHALQPPCGRCLPLVAVSLQISRSFLITGFANLLWLWINGGWCLGYEHVCHLLYEHIAKSALLASVCIAVPGSPVCSTTNTAMVTRAMASWGITLSHK